MKKAKTIVGRCFLACVAVSIAVGVWLFWPMHEALATLGKLTGNVEHGAYLARASGCFACHTNAEKGGAVLAGGGPLKTKFGTFYAPNITTHKRDGIGQWTLDDFANALTKGVSPEGHNYYPVFLYPNYAKLSDQDIADLWAAFQTVPPVEGKAPSHELKFPFQYRVLLTPWKRLFLDEAPIKKDSTKPDLWNRGNYLVNGPAHCNACHSARNILGGIDGGGKMAGNLQGNGGEKVPGIRPAQLKKNGWDKKALVFALRTGTKPDGDSFSGSMGEVVSHGTRFLQESDLEAIAEYILSGDEKT